MNKKVKNVALVAIAVLIAFTFNLHLGVYMFNTQAGFQIGLEEGNYAYYDHYDQTYSLPTLEASLSIGSVRYNIQFLIPRDWNGEDDPSPYMDIVLSQLQAIGNVKSLSLSTENGGSVRFLTAIKDETTIIVWNIWWGITIRNPQG